jgi:hypothetical protein
VNEFIESQKLRDRKLYKAFNESDEPPEVVPMLRRPNIMPAEEDPAIVERDKQEHISKC